MNWEQDMTGPSESEFPLDLVERLHRVSGCDLATLKIVLRESGHAELVEALREARKMADVFRCFCDPDNMEDLNRIDAALGKAGAL